ncbi:hypothetical protein KAJ27_11460, partial [bacterium]|nr:hypothetical protein [bacterium]
INVEHNTGNNKMKNTFTGPGILNSPTLSKPHIPKPAAKNSDIIKSDTKGMTSAMNFGSDDLDIPTWIRKQDTY